MGAPGTANAFEQRTNGGVVHIKGEPEPILVDPRGAPIEPKKGGLMERVNAKGGEEVTLRKSTLWFIGVSLVLVQVAFSYGGSLLGWARDDQTQKEQINTLGAQVIETRNDVKDLKSQFTEIQKVLQAQAVKDAEKRGYELKAAEGDHSK